ncbi:hypothetical protein N9M10_02935 [Hellea sp.]|nr:hypothetical protein [Hellea sp.]
MNDKLYTEYENYLALGRKKDAKIAIEKFIQSFMSYDEKKMWVESNILDLVSKTNRALRIRHEIFRFLVFPVLLEGYKNKSAEHVRLLNTFRQNLYSDKESWRQIDFKSPLELSKLAYELNPDNLAIRSALLSSLLSGFDWLDHEWPSGLLCRKDRSTINELLEEIRMAELLDDEGIHDVQLNEFKKHVMQWANFSE